MIFNDLDLDNWKSLEINVDTLWLINERDKSGKHSNVYHGNFIPQIPYQLISRYTKENDIVLDSFMGSGTTLYECEKLNRKFIGLDINKDIIDFVKTKMTNSNNDKFDIQECDVVNNKVFDEKIQISLKKFDSKSVQFAIMHPPYMDIIKFTNLENDLSQISDLSTFVKIFNKAITNTVNYLEKNRYFAIVIGDIYKNSEVIPLAFYVLDNIKRNFKVKLKGIVVKNIEGNRGKLGQKNIWKFRALKSDYFIFKHEYILVFKKEF
ncbi:MAG: DNA methyltransferase [Candidatus Cloacimonetes bacterium]|nr:DNA adenine methylase [Candidatus Cloacimonadota bacterium]MDD4156179.1 DNA methyltransferase [Candidatus Cloacimonadota bacterium]